MFQTILGIKLRKPGCLEKKKGETVAFGSQESLPTTKPAPRFATLRFGDLSPFFTGKTNEEKHQLGTPRFRDVQVVFLCFFSGTVKQKNTNDERPACNLARAKKY